MSYRRQLKDLLEKRDFEHSGIQLLLRFCGALLGDREWIMYRRRALPSAVEDDGDRGKAFIRASDMHQRQQAFDVQEDQELCREMDRKRERLMKRWNGNTLESVSVFFNKFSPSPSTDASFPRF